MFSWILDTGKLTKVGWMIIVVAIGIPIIILAFKLVDIYKNATGYESTETKLAKSRANVNTLDTVIESQKKSLEKERKVNKLTTNIITTYVNKDKQLDKVTNDVLNKVNIVKHDKPEKVVIIKHKTKVHANKHKKIDTNNVTTDKKQIVTDKEVYEEVGSKNIDAMYKLYDTVSKIGVTK